MSTNTLSVYEEPGQAYQPTSASRTFSVPHIREAIAPIRHRAATALQEWGMPVGAAEDVLLVVSELVTNSIVHGLAPVTLKLSLAQVDDRPGIRVEVSDHGPAPVCWPADWRADEHGRGNLIVEALAVHHCRVEFPGGTVYQAELAV